ncbi:HCLS1-binding protein 3 isoform X2 [Rhinatrema bivittatum]|uniref:HCLS1-binding protein 3 isoform X2 n=1 Tax=Rhinatrema bivittatum TaxID=194408 RepID=UPI00112CEB58|nr:HCLS1-binding protein 3 isoform X2 [Rhinatrema bivittatum]
MPAVLVTTRQIQNSHTGIDVSVLEYEEIRGKMMSGHVEYHILVVTWLAAFKSAKHKPEDVVQFVVSKKYSEIEDFCHRLASHYPHASLPPVPRKVLFVGESDIRERRAAFDEIMKCISKDENLATSPLLLEFLGTKSTSVVDTKSKNIFDNQHEEEEEEGEPLDFFREDKTSDVVPQLKPTTVPEPQRIEEQKVEEEEEEEALDPLGIMKSKKIKKPASAAKDEKPQLKPKPKLSLFDEEVDPDEGLFDLVKKYPSTRTKNVSSSKNDLKLFEDPDLGGTVKLGDSLLLPTAYDSKEQMFRPSLEEDTEELFRIEDNLDILLNLGSKSVNKSKPVVPTKPALPKKPKVATKTDDNSAPEAKQIEQDVQAMNEMDILQYIQENESACENSASLF